LFLLYDNIFLILNSLHRPRKSKKKKVRQIAGVSTAALEEARDIFGDVDELLRLRKQSLALSGRSRDSSELQGKRLEDEFEPFILKEKYLTEKDDSIRKIDMPERIQVLLLFKLCLLNGIGLANIMP
jgi:transcription elongation factor SPT6